VRLSSTVMSYYSYYNHTLFLQPVKPRWPCICMYMVRVGVRAWVRVWVRFRVCHDMFRTRSSMSTTTWKLEEIHKSFNLLFV